jgi:cell wall-associated NlpC family hydrolase
LSRIVYAAAGLVLAVVVVAGAAGAGFASLLTGGNATPSPAALAAIPPTMLTLYTQAAATCPGLPWTVLAAIGTVESDQGRNAQTSSAGAVGIMQFEPTTFAAYAQPVPPGGADPPSPYDPTDSVYAAARDLCANGARNGTDLPGAVWEYNHSTAYVDQVLALAQTYSASDAETVAAGTAGGIAADWALAQVGTPYIWGGETPGVGFDCSGLVQAAYKAAGVGLPRTAQAQYDVGPLLAPGSDLLPGDLVFFGAGPGSVTHVGLVVGPDEMVDAPHAGARVRVEPFPPAVGSTWGPDFVLAFTRPSH